MRSCSPRSSRRKRARPDDACRQSVPTATRRRTCARRLRLGPGRARSRPAPFQLGLLLEGVEQRRVVIVPPVCARWIACLTRTCIARSPEGKAPRARRHLHRPRLVAHRREARGWCPRGGFGNATSQRAVSQPTATTRPPSAASIRKWFPVATMTSSVAPG